MRLCGLLPLLLLSANVRAFKILVFYLAPSYSHQRAIMALTEKLVERGHELFVVSTNKVPGLDSSNYTYVDLSFSYQLFSDKKTDDGTSFQQHISKWDLKLQMKHIGAITKKQFLSQQFLQFQQKVKAEKQQFDVVIIETHYWAYGCAMTRFLTGNGSVPTVAMTTTTYDPYVEDNLGGIKHWSYIPSYYDSNTDKMNLWQRIENWYSELRITSGITDVIDEGAREFFRDNYGPESEGLVDGCWANMSLSIIASNFLYFYPRLLAPNVIETGPMHIKPPPKLPKNLQDWLDAAEKGVIYFSLGSNMKSKNLPEDVRANFLKFFRELPPGYRVLWKWELDGKIPGQSDNILGQKWIPQQSVLDHPKVKVFITQGGLQSFQEAVHYGVPLVGIPWFGDQECNVAKMVDAQIGVRLGPGELHSFEKVKSALEAVLYDDRYSKNMEKLSKISHDFTSQALDKAVFWVEHVARHGGASHLRPSTADTTYFQYFCLDIISVTLGLNFVVLYIFYSACKYVILNLFKSKNLKIKVS